jgi:hypothetical protein
MWISKKKEWTSRWKIPHKNHRKMWIMSKEIEKQKNPKRRGAK